MIAKKNERYDLERKRKMFLALGLLTSGSLTLAAFTYAKPSDAEIEKENVTAEMVQFMVDINEPEVEQPIIIQPKVERQESNSSNESSTSAMQNANENSTETVNKNEIVKSNVSLDGKNLKFDDKDYVDPIIEVSNDKIEPWVDVDASYVGGRPAMLQFIGDNFRHDRVYVDETSTVVVSFVVEKDGSLSNIKIFKSVSEEVDREAMRIVRSFPKWNPGELKAKKVRTIVQLPIKITAE